MANVVKKAVSVPADLLHGTKEGKMKTYQSSERSFSPSPSVESVDLENAGARLDYKSLSDVVDSSSPMMHHATGETASGHAAMENAPAARGSFQLGNQPDGDVFSSPAKEGKPNQDRRHVASPFDVSDLALAMPKNSPESGADEAPSHALRTQPSNLSGRHHVGGIDAQGVYPPTACVFVANLPQAREDQALEAAITREFSKFGTVFVKIRRDLHHMPFAFCQFTKDEDANAALEQGRGTMILGRACRTEMVKANRTFVVYKRRNGPKITVGEVRELMLEYGALNKCEYLRLELAEKLQLPSAAVVVEFAMFDADRDVIKAFRHDGVYRVEPLDLKRSDVSRNNPDEEYLRQYEIDRRSVFVGNLPEQVTEGEIVALFEEVGDVHKAQVIKKESSTGVRAFAFVEYSRPDLPEQAVERFDNTSLNGMTIKVERKMAKKEQLRTPRRVKSQILPRWSSPTANSQSAGTPATPNYRRPTATVGEEAAVQIQDATASAPPAWSWVYGMQPVVGSNYGYGGPHGHYTAQQGSGQTAVTPQATPGAVNPYAYYGGFWPGMSYVQDPSWAFQGYATPTHASQPARSPNDNDHLATPTHATGSPSEQFAHPRRY